MEEYDYVIVGGGTAGSVLANRLTEDPDVRVLVLEAGANFVPANVDVAPLWYTLLGSEVDWGYETVPQHGLGNRRVYEPRGKLPGGSSNLYIMMHIRGHPSDFDNWAYQGAAGWSYEDLAPYFAKLEAQEDRTDPRIGTAGPQTVTFAGGPDAHPLSQVFIDACKELDKHYIPTRYPNGFERGAPVDFYTRGDADRAIAAAQVVIGFCRHQIDRRRQDPGGR